MPRELQKYYTEMKAKSQADNDTLSIVILAMSFKLLLISDAELRNKYGLHKAETHR